MNNMGILLDENGNNFYPHSASGEFIQEFTVDGDADTYYPVLFSCLTRNNSNHLCFSYQKFSIYRQYNWTAPDTWHTPTHKGGLTFSFMWNGDCYWGGNGYGTDVEVLQLLQIYSTTCIDYSISTSGIIIWLRGGGALYRYTSDLGACVSEKVFLEGYTDLASRTFSPTTDSTVKITNKLKIPTLGEVYPVGSIYLSVNSTNPATLFGRNLVSNSSTDVL